MSNRGRVQATWVGPERNPLLAAQLVTDDEEVMKKLESCVVGIFNWYEINPDDNLLDELLQEIAGETNIVVQYRDGGWYAAMDEEAA